MSKQHKLRDAKIIRHYATDSKTMDEIGEIVNLTPRRVGQILYANKDFLKADREFEKIKRLQKLERVLKNTPEYLGKNRDVIDILEAQRKELEGDGKSDTTVNNITYNINGSRKNSRLEVLSSSISTDDSQLDSKI